MDTAVLVDVQDNNSVHIPICSNKFSIGRALQNELIIEQVNISRIHCTIENVNNHWIIVDKSSNGTRINGAVLGKTNSCNLESGDIICLNDKIKYVFRVISNTTEEVIKVKKIDLNETGSTSNNISNVINKIMLNNENSEVESTSSATNKCCKESSQLSGSDSFEAKPLVLDLYNNLVAVSNVQVTNPGNTEDVITTKLVTPGCDQNVSSKLESLENELQCTICTEIFIQAVTLPCSHTFCKYCILQWQKHQTICPICRTYFNTHFPTRVLDNFIEKALEKASDIEKEQRRKIIEERETALASTSSQIGQIAPGDSLPSTSAGSTSASFRRKQTNRSYIINLTGSSDDDDDDDDDYDSIFNDDYSFSMSDESDISEYNYARYGRCFNCGQKGHWANCCPKKRRRIS